MPFIKRDIPSFVQWQPGKDFNASRDRLLVETTFNDVFVARWSSHDGGNGKLMLDPDFMPQNFAEIPNELKLLYGIDIRGSKYDWYVFLHDGQMAAGGGYFVEMHAIGEGWIRKISSGITPRTIEPVDVSRISRREVSENITGVRFHDFEFAHAMPRKVRV